MNRHLSAEEFSRSMSGDPTPAIERHIRECPECRAELATLESALTAFRGSVREWSGDSAPFVNYRAPTAQRSRRLQWFLAVAALIVLLAAIPVYRNSRARQQRQVAETAADDARLLQQVDAEISRAVPEPMEPLERLVSWGTGPADANKNGKTQ